MQRLTRPGHAERVRFPTSSVGNQWCAATIVVSFTLAAALAVEAARSAEAAPGGQKPFFDARTRRAEYAGPGREQPSQEQVDEALIGYFGPGDPTDPVAGDLWRAAQTAVDEANREGGYRGAPFRLVPAWSADPWGTGVKQLARLVYVQKVWAIVGGVDGPTTHLAEQLAAKARVPLVSPISTDKTVQLANVPWMFSLAPGDHLLAPVLADEIAARAGGKGFILISADDHDPRLLTTELRKALSLRGVTPRYQYESRRGGEDLGPLIARVVGVGAPVVLVVGDADSSAPIVRLLRSEGFKGNIFAGPAAGRRRFLDKAGDAAEGVLFPMLVDPHAASMSRPHSGGPPLAVAQGQRCRQRLPLAQCLRGRDGPLWPTLPFPTATGADAAEQRSPARADFDYAAAHVYDAVRLTIEAIRQGGLNRARIRDAICGLSPWKGVTGEVRWDGLGGNTRSASLAVVTRSAQGLTWASPPAAPLAR